MINSKPLGKLLRIAMGLEFPTGEVFTFLKTRTIAACLHKFGIVF
jgi:hypothetical protein